MALDQRTLLRPEIMPLEQWVKAVNVLQLECIELYCAKKSKERQIANATELEADEELTPEPVANQRRRLVLDLATSTEARFAISQQNLHNAETQQILSEEDYRRLDETNGETEFQVAHRQWQDWNINWDYLFPKNIFVSCDLIDELRDLDACAVMKEAERINNIDNRFKLLPQMCRSSKFQLGAPISQSHAERMNSAGRNVASDHRGKLDAEMVDKLVVLRMNRKFMEFTRQKNAKRQRSIN